MRPRNYKTLLSLGFCLTFTANAEQLIYKPTNPSFGGSSLNGNWMLSQAQAQDSFKDPDQEDPLLNDRSSLTSFNEMLQRSILNRLSSTVSSNIIGASGELTPGEIETTDFIIEIADMGGGVMQITTTDKVTGDSTSFQVDYSL